MGYTVYFALFLVIFIHASLAVSKYDTGSGEIYRLKVTQDVSLESPATNYNYLPYLIIGRHPDYPLKRSLIQFEQLPKTCSFNQILWAKMYLNFAYAHKASYDPVHKTPYLSHTINLHVVKKSWQERSATSSKRYTGISWHSSYLNLGIDAEKNPETPQTTLFSYRPFGFMEFDVTNAVKGWRTGKPNYGLLIKVVNEQLLGRDLRFFSKNSGDAKKNAYIDVLCYNPVQLVKKNE